MATGSDKQKSAEQNQRKAFAPPMESEPLLSDFPWQGPISTKEKYTTTHQDVVDNCYYMRIRDNAVYDMLDLKNAGYPLKYTPILEHRFVFRRVTERIIMEWCTD